MNDIAATGFPPIDFRYGPPISWTSICRPDDPFKSLVREDGGLLYGFETETFWAFHFKRAIEFGIQTGDRPTHYNQQTESARVPVVITRITYPRATLELQTFGHLHDDGRRTDVVLWTITANADVDEFLTGLRIDALETDRAFWGRSTGRARAIYAVRLQDVPKAHRWNTRIEAMPDDAAGEAIPDGAELAFISAPQRLRRYHTTGFRPGSGLATEPVILHAGEQISGAIILPLNYTDSTGLDETWAYRALETERTYWNALPLPARALEVPDPAVMDMLTACARNILQAREIEAGLPAFKVGPTVYRNLFVVDGHFMLEAARYLGYDDEATAAIDTLLRRVRPNGAIAEMLHHTKETGISIATLIRQCELLGDDERLRALWPTIQNAVRYIEGLRTEAKALHRNDPCYGLLPKAFGDGGVGGERGEYTTAMWILFGLKAAAEVAARLGYDDDAEHFKEAFDSLMADFRTHIKGVMKTLPDGTSHLPQWFPENDAHHWVPNYPETVEPWHRLRPESATWAFCQAIWPGEVFTPDDPLVRNLLHLHDLVDDEQGIPTGTGWLPYRAMWGYHAAFAANVWLYAGRPDKAVDYLYAFANHATPTRVWREEQSVASTGNGELFGDMPHNWASVEFIRLVRHLLVFERGETLELLAGVPGAWMQAGARLAVNRTPTRFGPVTLEATFQSDAVRAVVVFDAGWVRKPKQVTIILPGFTRAEIDANGQTVGIDTSGRLTLPFQGQVQVVAHR